MTPVSLELGKVDGRDSALVARPFAFILLKVNLVESLHPFIKACL